MKQCVKFPEDKFLAVRTCLVAICMGNRPAANLLSILLFRYNLRMENKDDAENQNAVKAAKGESPDQDTSVRIFRTQAQLVEDMCGEITEKTLHDTAVPMLQLLGFLDLEEHMIANCYILHIDLVQQALNLYLPGKKEQPQLEKFLISTMQPQLEKFLIDLYGLQLEEVLIDKKFFLSGLEKVLIQNRKISNHQRGRKVKPEAVRVAKIWIPKNREEITKKDREEEREGVSADAENPLAFSRSPENESSSHSHAATGKEDEEDDTPTEGSMPAITTGKQFKRVAASKGVTNDTPTSGNISHLHGSGHADLSTSSAHQRAQERPLEPKGITDGQSEHRPDRHGGNPDTGLHNSNHPSRPVPLHLLIEQTTSQAREVPPGSEVAQGTHERNDGAATDRGSEPRASSGNVTQEKSKRSRKQPQEVHLTLHEQEIKQWYEELRGVSVSFSKRNITALAALGKRTMSKDDFLSVTAILDSDPWFEEKKIGVDLYWIDRQWENKIVYLHRKKAASPSIEKTPYNSIEAALAIKNGTKQQKAQGGHD